MGTEPAGSHLIHVALPKTILLSLRVAPGSDPISHVPGSVLGAPRS